MYLVLFEDYLLTTSKTDRQRVKRASKSKMINGCVIISCVAWQTNLIVYTKKAKTLI